MKFNPHCRSCRRLTHYLSKVQEKHPGYHNAPVDSFGADVYSVLVVGLAPGLHGANKTGRPFTGDASGDLLFKTLYTTGFASKSVSLSPGDGLALHGLRITNAVRCLPPENKPSTRELKLCGRYLVEDLRLLERPGVLVALGRLAHEAVLRVLGLRLRDFPFSHAAEYRLDDGLVLIDSFHCSRYNTQTKRLTPDMFEAVFQRAAELRGFSGE